MIENWFPFAECIQNPFGRKKTLGVTRISEIDKVSLPTHTNQQHDIVGAMPAKILREMRASTAPVDQRLSRRSARRPSTHALLDSSHDRMPMMRAVPQGFLSTVSRIA
jgi:hypothetical protein